MKPPPDFGTVTPYFVVDGADRFVHFLVKAFGGVETLRHLRPDGAIANVQVRIGNVTLMVGEPQAGSPSWAGHFCLYVEDAHASLRRALEAGATLVSDVADMPYGDRQAGVRDAHGNTWWISQRLVEGPYT